MKVVRESLNPIYTNSSLNEGWKENILTGLMLLAGVAFGKAQTSQLPKQDQVEYMHKQTSSEKVVNQLIKQGWTLDKTTLDTIWESVIKIEKMEPGVAEIITSEVKDQEAFTPGGFELTENFKSNIESKLEEFQGYPFINIRIQASTDKQGLKPNLQQDLIDLGYTANNQGLCEARADVIKDFLINELGVASDPDSIIVDLTPEQGQGTAQEYKTGEFRFVKVQFNFVNIIQKEAKEVSKEVKVPRIKKTYDLSSRIEHGDGKTFKTPSGPICKTKINKFQEARRGTVKVVSCPKFNK